ncbi:MAG: sigma-E processing peptidase SpoIIGA [Erysipelotrichaceae bacterium]
MQSYIEVAIINNSLIIILSVLIASYVQLHPLKYFDILVYAFSVSLASVLLWGSQAWIIMLLIEILSLLYCFKRQYKVYLLTLVLRFLISYSDYLIFKGSFHLFVYYLPLNNQMIIVQWVIILIIMIAIHRKWKSVLIELQYLYNVTLYFPNKTIRLRGYLDSGNMLCHHHLPIIFIDLKYKEYLKKDNIELIVMNTMNAKTKIQAVPVSLKVNGFKKQKVLVSCIGKLTLPIHCDCLLNVHNISMG